jgi:hypothetical protein
MSEITLEDALEHLERAMKKLAPHMNNREQIWVNDAYYAIHSGVRYLKLIGKELPSYDPGSTKGD